VTLLRRRIPGKGTILGKLETLQYSIHIHPIPLILNIPIVFPNGYHGLVFFFGTRGKDMGPDPILAEELRNLHGFGVDVPAT
jgi:hypothetical protein